MDAIELLKEDHRVIKDLFSRFEAAHTDEDKGSIAKTIFLELETHAMIEEEHFYPTVRSKAKEKSTTINHSFEEHREVDALIQKMKGMDTKSSEFRARMNELRDRVEHHIEEEEQELLPKTREVLGDLILDLGNTMIKRKEQSISVIDEQQAREKTGATG